MLGVFAAPRTRAAKLDRGRLAKLEGAVLPDCSLLVTLERRATNELVSDARTNNNTGRQVAEQEALASEWQLNGTLRAVVIGGRSLEVVGQQLVAGNLLNQRCAVHVQGRECRRVALAHVRGVVWVGSRHAPPLLSYVGNGSCAHPTRYIRCRRYSWPPLDISLTSL